MDVARWQKWIPSLILLCSATCESTAFLDSQTEARLQVATVFKSIWSHNFDPVGCHRNIRNFTQALIKKGIDIDPLKIWILTPSNHLALHPLNPRALWASQDWDFHVVAEYAGVIYDFSMGKTPTPLNVSAYFNRMFQHADARILNADDFVHLPSQFFSEIQDSVFFDPNLVLPMS